MPSVYNTRSPARRHVNVLKPLLAEPTTASNAAECAPDDRLHVRRTPVGNVQLRDPAPSPKPPLGTHVLASPGKGRGG